MSDDHLPLLHRQGLQCTAGRVGVDLGGLAGTKPRRRSCGGPALMSPPPLGGTAGINGGIAYDAVQPGNQPIRRLPLRDELQEGFLDDVLRRGAPLPRIKHQRRGVLIDQPAKNFRAHHLNDVRLGTLSQKNTVRQDFYPDLVRMEILT